MNYTERLQIKIPPLDKGVLTIVFTGKSSMDDISLFLEAIDAKLSGEAKITSAVFDLAEVDRVMNSAGRIFDLACLCRAVHKIPIEVRLPKDIFDDLHETTPKEVPAFSGAPIKVRGVTLIEVPRRKPADEEGPPGRTEQKAEEIEPKTILSCVGKIQHVDGSQVTVALFIDPSDPTQMIIGEFDKAQFPTKKITAGMMFDYEARIIGPGRCSISIDVLPELMAPPQELFDEAQRIRKEIGEDLDKI